VYDVPCKDCRKTYIGETKWALRARRIYKEHRQAVKSGDPKNEIAVHVHNTQHAINWMGARGRNRKANYCSRRTIEAIQIKHNEP